MKFLFVIPTLANGGAERVVSVLATALTEQKQAVTVVKYYAEENEYPVGDKVRIVNLSGGDNASYRALGKLKQISKLRNAVKSEKPDFVIPFMFPVAQMTAIATVGISVSVIQSIRINPAAGPAQKWRRALRDRLVYRSKCTFVQNETQKQYFRKQYHDKIHVLYNPIPEGLFLAKPKESDGTFTVCSMGRLSGQKNFSLLIEAFADAFAAVECAELKIYGEGTLKDELQSYIEQTGLSDRIKLMGRTNDVQKVYEHTDLFVLPSDFEGMPNALMEAMACHVPCISTDCPTGPSDLIENGVNGILVPVADRAAMAEALRAMYRMTPEARFAMAEKGRQTVREKCAQEQIARQMIAVCKSLSVKA